MTETAATNTIPKSQVVETDTRPIMVVGCEHTSTKLVSLIKVIANFIGNGLDHGANLVILRNDDLPIVKVKGTKDTAPILADVSMHHGSIAINLMETLSSCLELQEEHPKVSIYALWWHNMLLSVIHELLHLRQFVEAPKPKTFMHDCLVNGEAMEKLEKQVKRDAETILYALAKTVNLEPPAWGEETFFATQVMELITCGKEKETNKQAEWLNDRVFIALDKPIQSFKEYLHINSGDAADDPAWNAPVVNVEPKKLETGFVVPQQPAAVETTPVTATVAQPTTAQPVETTTSIQQEYSEYEEMTEPGGETFEGGCFFGSDIFTQPQPAQQPVMPTTQPVGQPTFSQPIVQPQPSTAAATFSFGPGGTGTPSIPMGGVGGRPTIDVYPNHNLSPEQIREAFYSVASKIFQHIFTHCQPQAGGSPEQDIMGFAYPEAVSKIPVVLTQDEMKVVVKCDCLNEMGQWQPGRLTSDGKVLGQIAKNTKLPMYKIHLNINGQPMVRVLVPQNPNKRTPTGGLKQTASNARQGTAIMYVYEGNDALKQTAIGGGIKSKCVNGQWEIINA